MIKKIWIFIILLFIFLNFSKINAYNFSEEFEKMSKEEKIIEIKKTILKIKIKIQKILIEINNKKKEMNRKKIYNQAYQENYKADNIDDIVKNAKESYVLLDIDNIKNIDNKIKVLKKNNNIIACYTSIGTAEDWRDDFKKMKNNISTMEWKEWKGEYFISKIDKNLEKIMKDRIDFMSKKGCEYVEFDNMDWADNEKIKKYKLKISQEESRDYVHKICQYAHKKNMKCMAKSTNFNDNIFDGLTVESYNDDKNWWNKKEMIDVLKNKKIGIIVHYNEEKCGKVFGEYDREYKNISFICESRKEKKYLHFK